MIFVPIRIYLNTENAIRLMELAKHTLESKGSVGYRCKRAYLIYIYQNNHQK